MTREIDRRSIRLLALACLCGALAGCQDYLSRSDKIASWSGDAIAANAATQTINPWPRAAFDQRQVTQGSKIEDAMKIYRLPPAAPATAPATSAAAAPSTMSSAPIMSGN